MPGFKGEGLKTRDRGLDADRSRNAARLQLVPGQNPG